MKTSLVTPHNQTLPRIKTDRLLFPRAAVSTLLMLTSFVTVAQILCPAEVLRKHVLLPFRTQPVCCPFIEMPPRCPGGLRKRATYMRSLLTSVSNMSRPHLKSENKQGWRCSSVGSVQACRKPWNHPHRTAELGRNGTGL